MEYTQVGLIIILVLAICQGIKYTGLSSRWMPLISVVLALAGSYLFDGVNFLSTAAGVILGLGTSGLYDVVKKSILNK
jgi:hypothetical protein